MPSLQNIALNAEIIFEKQKLLPNSFYAHNVAKKISRTQNTVASAVLTLQKQLQNKCNICVDKIYAKDRNPKINTDIHFCFIDLIKSKRADNERD